MGRLRQVKYSLRYITFFIFILTVVYLALEEMISRKVVTTGDTKFNRTRKTTERVNSTKTKTVTTCLYTKPGIRKYEVDDDHIYKAEGRYCPANTSKSNWNIDFNIERSYRFCRADSTILCSPDNREKNITQPGIPKKLHFIWTDAKIPSMFIPNLKRYRDLHPNWEINFWTLAHGRKLISKLEPRLLKSYDSYPMAVSRSDALRYVIMYHVGGVYLDMDTYPRIPLDNLTSIDSCMICPESMESAVFYLGIRSLLNNAGFLCRPKHPFFRFVIDQLPPTSRSHDTLKAAGPLFFSKSFNSFLNTQLSTKVDKIDSVDEAGITVMKHEYFEFLFHDTTKDISLKECKKFMENSSLESCIGKDVFTENCAQLYKNLTNKGRLYFDACSEWLSHGGNNRNISETQRYINHLHVQTYSMLGKIKYESEEKLKQMLPQINLHL